MRKKKPKPRCYRGFRDIFSGDLLEKRRMIERVRSVYESYGFVPLETPALEFVDILGKFRPDSDTPEGGIYSFKNPDIMSSAEPSHPDYWLALRYELTASLARVVAQYADLPRPFRRYQIGNVWRHEKPGPGRYREFLQMDFDSVGVASVAADAEAVCICADVLSALGFTAGSYTISVNSRKILMGVLEAAGLADVDISETSSPAGITLRAIDKLDRLGIAGVRELLGAGRKDKTGDFTEGANLSSDQISKIDKYLTVKGVSRNEVCDKLAAIIGDSEIGCQGIAELREIDTLISSLGYAEDAVIFDPTVVRGLGYYTGPVFEAVLNKEITDAKGHPVRFGSIFGGGRYDNLVERFTGQKMPATGASVGVDRLYAAMKLMQKDATERTATADVLITVMDRERLRDYFTMAGDLRKAGLNAEVYLGSGGIGKQLKYADKTGVPFVVIAGSDEFSNGIVQVKDLTLGSKLSKQVETREEWREERPAQQEIKLTELTGKLKAMLEADQA